MFVKMQRINLNKSLGRNCAILNFKTCQKHITRHCAVGAEVEK